MSAAARIKLLVLTAWLAFAGLATRLYALQVKRSDEFRTRAERRRRRVDFLPPRRGRILDRAGRPLALDRAVCDVVVELPDLDPALDLVPAIGRATRTPLHEAARLLREAREKVRAGAKAAEVGVALDDGARGRAEKLARRFPGLALAPRDAGGWSVVAPASFVGLRDERVARLAHLLGVEARALRATVQGREDEIRAIPDGKDGKGRDERLHAWNEPLVVAEDVGFDVAAAIEEASTETPGFCVVRRFVRCYPQGERAAHVLGFLGKLSDQEAAALRRQGRLIDECADAGGLLLGLVRELPPGARLRSQPIGRSGLEGKLDARLAGVPGARVVERDAHDRSRVTFLDVPPRDGEDVPLALDLDLQAAAEAAIDEALAKHGEPGAGAAAVLLDARSGEILALASAPRFDPNSIGSSFAELNADPAHPFCHRAVAAVPPGSTFKVLSSLAFFGEGGLPLSWTADCHGALVAGQKMWHCDEPAGHGTIGLVEALAHSCNVFFFKAADARGSEPLVDWAARLELAKRVAPFMPLEQAGRVPAGVGPIVRNTAIGQGDVGETPLQVARLAAIVGTGERAPRIKLLREGDETLDESEPAVASDEPPLRIEPALLGLVREGLAGCVQRGTASKPAIGLCALDVAGKTGTAERKKGEPNYAWFMGYYPASRPEVAFAVLVDRTKGHGGDVCGPAARKLIDAYARSRGEEPKRR